MYISTLVTSSGVSKSDVSTNCTSISAKRDLLDDGP